MGYVIKLQAPFERIKLFNISPEISLRRAIIIQAIIDASNISDNPQAKRLEIEAKEWLFSNSQYFINVCEEGEIEPKFVQSIAKKIISLHHDQQTNIKNIAKSTKYQTDLIKQYNMKIKKFA